jgi:hypothetical protein
VSFTVTVNVEVPSSPNASLAAQVTVVTPSGNVSPGAWLHVTERELEKRSVAVGGVKLTLAPAPLVASAATSAGALEKRTGTKRLFTMNPLAEFAV